jgi:hypothetical protein
VTAIVLFLFARAVVATVIEVKVVGSEVMAIRVGATLVWTILLVGIAVGKEPARFFVTMALAVGSALAVVVLMDPEMMWYDSEGFRIEWVRYYLMVFIATNLALVPLLAFSKRVRSFFSRVPAYAGPIQ